MRSATLLAESPSGDQVIRIGRGRLALAFGPVLLPLTAHRLVKLSETLAAIAADFERYAQEGLAYVHCDQLVLRFRRPDLLQMIHLVIEGLDALQREELDQLPEWQEDRTRISRIQEDG